MASTRSRRSRPTAAPDKTGEKESAGSLLRFVLGVAILAWLLRTFIVQPFYIPSGSMVPTLYIGDYLDRSPNGRTAIRATACLSAIRPFGGRVVGNLPKSGGRGRISSSGRRRGFDQTSHRRSGRHRRSSVRATGPQRTPRAPQGSAARTGRNLPEQPVPSGSSRQPGHRRQRQTGPYCLYRAYPRDIAGGPSYTVLDQIERGPGDDFAADKGSRRAHVPDGRQS